MPGVRLLACTEDMSWAKFAIEKLKNGETVQIRPRGHSMKGKVNDGDLVMVEPCDPEGLSMYCCKNFQTTQNIEAARIYPAQLIAAKIFFATLTPEKASKKDRKK